MARNNHDEHDQHDENANDQTVVMPAAEVPDGGADAAGSPPVAAPAPASEGGFEQPPLVAIIEVNGVNDGHVSLIVGGAGEIGRIGDELSVRLPYDPLVSRTHARLSYQQGAWLLEDIHSTNGVWLDGARTRLRQPTALALGQIFRVGHTDLMLTDDHDTILSHGEPL
jgi:pSer/pThr/pTyr-binding forkhead associated (FHA) protein